LDDRDRRDDDADDVVDATRGDDLERPRRHWAMRASARDGVIAAKQGMGLLYQDQVTGPR
jgi:hypothetical protein